MGIKIWPPYLGGGGFLLPGTRHHCQFNTICSSSSSSPRLLPLSQPRQNKSRWWPQVAAYDSSDREDAGRCRELLCGGGNHPGRIWLVLESINTSSVGRGGTWRVMSGDQLGGEEPGG
ncbi:hypothetical protein CesoFtcFv8_000534 [Champsocephalus esox]|uniref:Uncharacterized protein n=1 Tax=Champsocephalus esox TaxID=159716 RepID=A0AAN8D5I1_9TELE|nr:hypothetical protein CesoFtcFv8_000534 [Champsocephalus esox]